MNIKWSPTRIDTANYCRMRYYLRYVCGEKEDQLPAFEKGGFLHGLIENFWKGIEERKYDNSDEFAKYARGKWRQRIIAAEKSGRQIVWNFEGEKWMIDGSLPKICGPLFDALAKEGPPIYSEVPFDFVLGNKRFTGRIDEIRVRDGKVVVRDYKSGRPWMGEMKIKHDPQMTIYNVGLMALCFDNERFAKSIGIGDERRKFMGNSEYVNENIDHEFFMVESCGINPSIRTNNHFFEVIKMIDGTLEAVATNNIYPERGRKCDSCALKKACEKRVALAGQDNPHELDGQMAFSFANPLYAKPIKKPKKRQRRFKWK